MRIVSVSNLKGNEILARQIYDELDRILLNEGVKLTPSYIKKIQEMGIHSVYVEDELSKDIVVEENISDKTRQMSKRAVKQMVEMYCRQGKVDDGSVSKSIDSILEDVLANKDLLINVSQISESDNNLYAHSVNVSVLATIIGTHMGLNMAQLKDLATGAILHDIGKMKMMNDKKLIAELKTKEAIEQYIQAMHPRVGYDFLGEQKIWNAHIKVAVLMHHEKYDGSGYPMKVKGDEINKLAKIVSICNVFDNLISARKDEKRKSVSEAIEYLMAMSNIHFDAEIVKKFTMNIAAFPTGSGVVLNSNQKGLVISQNKNMPLRPVVKVIYDQQGNVLSAPYEVDLLKELTVFITKSCEF
jgi:putative nucleotidyltransferase with HDIG domain